VNSDRIRKSGVWTPRHPAGDGDSEESVPNATPIVNQGRGNVKGTTARRVSDQEKKNSDGHRYGSHPQRTFFNLNLKN